MSAGPTCLLALLAFAACGRIGYDGLDLVEVPTDAAADRPSAPDTADVPVDQPPAPADGGVTATYGRQSGTLFTDVCPDGQVLVGFEGAARDTSGTIYDSLVGRCGPLLLSPAPPYEVSAAPFRGTLPARGTGQVTFGAGCSQGQAVVGFEGRADPDLRALSHVCTDLVVTGGPGTFEVTAGNRRTVYPFMNAAGGTPFSFACPPGQLARGTHFWAGPAIQAVGLACGTVSVRP